MKVVKPVNVIFWAENLSSLTFVMLLTCTKSIFINFYYLPPNCTNFYTNFTNFYHFLPTSTKFYFVPLISKLPMLLLKIAVHKTYHHLYMSLISQYLLSINQNDCNWTRTHNHLARKPTLNHLAKLASSAKWLSVCLRTK